MKIRIAPEILRDFPGLKIGVVSAHNCDNQAMHRTEVHLDAMRLDAVHRDIEKKLLYQQEKVRTSLKSDQIAAHPHISIWRSAYKKFGAKDYPSSVENLVRRVIKSGNLKSISSFVDAYNYISLKYLLPIGGENLDAIDGDIVLAYAGSSEKPVRVFGEETERAPEPGEVIYKDATGTICRRWNWRGTERTHITPKTTNAVFVLESLGLPPQVVEHATNELAVLLQTICGGSVTVAFLDEKTPEIVLKKDATYRSLNQPQAPVSEVNVYVQHDAQDTSVSSEHEIRIHKVQEMRKHGIEPWPAVKPVTATCKEVVDEFTDEVPKADKIYALCGRIMSIRLHGKAAFAHVQDRTGKLQLYIKQDMVGDASFEFFKSMIDVGDILWCSGTSFRTKMGEVTLEVKDFSLMSKCLYPLPEKFHGLTDVEVKYRQRYLDLMTNPEARERFIKRTNIIKQLRTYLDAHDFVEVETPMLHPMPGGAAARPFVTHHNALDTDFYLRIAPELYLKRLVIGGIERVYEINRNFRNEGVSTRHNPEFTMLEFYMANQDYHYIMSFVEDMLRSIVKSVCNTLIIPFGNHTLNFEEPFLRINMQEALVMYGGLTEDEITPQSIDATMRKHKISCANKNPSHGEKIYALFEERAESKLIEPTFIIDFPIEVSPLAKRDAARSEVAARFELFIAGMEISNAFNELNDPFDQAARFKQQAAAGESGDIEAHRYDAEYITALEYGLPPTVGVGIGIDRFVMLVTNTTSIKEVILFPALKRKEG
jgi:lysyl-tRNA synthetase class 2